jgi:hypothetical protein
VIPNIEFLLALALICTGIGFIFWPAALIVGGVLLLIDRIT